MSSCCCMAFFLIRKNRRFSWKKFKLSSQKVALEQSKPKLLLLFVLDSNLQTFIKLPNRLPWIKSTNKVFSWRRGRFTSYVTNIHENSPCIDSKNIQVFRYVNTTLNITKTRRKKILCTRKIHDELEFSKQKRKTCEKQFWITRKALDLVFSTRSTPRKSCRRQPLRLILPSALEL